MLSATPLWHAIQINSAANAAIAANYQPGQQAVLAQTMIAPLAQSGDCEAQWLQAYMISRSSPNANDIWDSSLNCDARYVELLHARSPMNVGFAEKAIRYQPDSAVAWFWMGELTRTDDPDQSIAYYQHGLSLDPHDGLHACQLGSLLRSSDRLAAREAYGTCCFNGDPGFNGCYNAGIMANEDGDWETAIRLYRSSHWSFALALADELESQHALTPSSP